MTTWLPGASEVFTHGFTSRPFLRALRATRPAASMTLGFEVLVHEVIAAMTTSPWPISWLASATGARFFSSRAFAEFVGHHFGEAFGDAAEHDAVLRALRAGERGAHVGEREFERVGEFRLFFGAPEALLLAVGFDERDARGIAAGGA